MTTSTPAFSFDRARYAGDPPPPDSCVFCHRGLRSEYFRINGRKACATCALRAESLLRRDTHAAFSRALLFGLAAAVAGCVAYALVEILTGFVIGWAALGVGFLVGWAMKRGSRGLGGRRYQVASALLTYAAVAIAFVPVALHEAKQPDATHRAAVTQPASPAASATASTQPAPAAQHHAATSVIAGLFLLLGLGLVSPFLLLASSVASGLLNLFILAIGIQTAWKKTAPPRAEVEGPFEQSPPAAAAGA